MLNYSTLDVIQYWSKIVKTTLKGLNVSDFAH